MSIYNYYVQCVKENLPLKKEQYFFKSDPRYNYVLEHVSVDQANQYLQLIKNEFAQFYAEEKSVLLSLSLENDKYGRPNKSYIQGFGPCSPTNLRYLYQALLILEYIASEDIKEVDIIEIGGGYGGLSLFLHHLCDFHVETKIKSYTIFDIPEICELQRRYLNIHDIELADQTAIKKNSFLISNYGFSELPLDIRQDYTNRVIQPYTSHGFLAWNHSDLYEFVEGKEISSEVERPLTGSTNLFVRYKPK